MSTARALTLATEAARKAGAVLVDARGRKDADADAERAIRETLLSEFPWRYIGSEIEARRGGDAAHVWLVEAHDGSRSALSGARGSAISIGALRDGVPVLGVVFAFAFPDDAGDLLCWCEETGAVERNGVRLPPHDATLKITQLERNDIVLVAKGAWRNAPALAAALNPARFRAFPSVAYRLALAAADDGVAAIARGRIEARKLVAGHALLRASGKTLLDGRGEPVSYGMFGDGDVRGCVGGPRAVVAQLCQMAWPNDAALETQRGPFVRARLRGGRRIDPAVLARAQGCLLGQFSGDALGSQVEFRSSSSIRDSHPRGVREIVDGGTWNTLAGQPTDDSELALMLARSLVKENGFELGAVLDAYVHWYVSHPFDIGATTSAALRAASLGETRAASLERVAEVASRTSQANGSLMRISPLGILGASQPEIAAQFAREDSGLTHPHTNCRESCAAFVVAIATAIGSKANARDCYTAALEEAKRGGNSQVIATLEKAAVEPVAKFDGGDSGWVILALHNAFYQLLHSRSVEEGIVATIAGGGDTDTTAAIAGALLGAIHGREGVPQRWRELVLSCRSLREADARHPRPPEFWPVDALELAERLLTLTIN